MSQEEDLKPKLNLSINYEGQRRSNFSHACPLLTTHTDITVKVKSNMPFKKIFAAAEVRVGYCRTRGHVLTYVALQERFGKVSGMFRRAKWSLPCSLVVQARSDLSTREND